MAEARPSLRGLGFGSKRRETSTEICEVADSNLRRVEDALLALPAPAAGPARAAWDHRTRPVRLEAIAKRFGLTAAERARLDRLGFVVADRLAQPSYGWAYHEIYQSQLPVFVSVDSILDTVYATHDHLVAQLETRDLAPRLARLLGALHCALPAATARYTPDAVHDLDVYLTVARSLLANRPVPSATGDAAVDREAAALVGLAMRAGELARVELFGRPRVIDFTQLTPRGHYTEELAPYFRAAMWLARLELNLVSRSSRSSAPGPELDPRETPREAVDALALADLVGVAHAGADLERFDQVYGWLAGRREDVSMRELANLAAVARIDLRAPGAADQLRAAIGDRFQRTARIHPMPEGATTLPAIATLLGPRIVPDTAALRPLAHGETPGRGHIRAGDLAYVLGNDRGKDYLKDDLAAHPALAANLDRARALLAAAPRTDDLYTAWLDALRALAQKPTGAVPSFMDGAAFADLRLATTIAGYAQLRHNHVLLAGEAYGEGGCEIPDGFVEPAPAVYDALARYADLGATKLALFDAEARAYFERLGKLARVLAVISRFELANQPLPAAAQQFLSMVTEILPYGSDGRPTYTGWFFDLFLDRSDAIARADLVASYFTSPLTSTIDYIGTGAPRLGVFVVDTGGGPRALVGPVAHAYEYSGPLATRLDDNAAAALPAAALRRPWDASYAVPAPPEPSLAIRRTDGDFAWEVTATRDLGPVTIQALDHHRMPVATLTRRVRAGTTTFAFKLPKARDDEYAEFPKLLHITVGPWQAWPELHCMDGCGVLGFGTFRDAPPEDPPDEP